MTDKVYNAIKEGQSVTLPGFGGCSVKPKGETWAFTFTPGQKLRALLGWSSTGTGKREEGGKERKKASIVWERKKGTARVDIFLLNRKKILQLII